MGAMVCLLVDGRFKTVLFLGGIVFRRQFLDGIVFGRHFLDDSVQTVLLIQHR